ncbi:winged helix-turn-helix domain-containing protein [Vallitalea okinawensis]|uniref:winged helix-turn-helix domain-containing protein n=1 Tax=Vallitalea okinawensis TaxID=2078660 RepID=UPI000CFDCB79|nr:helix-turn-helix domain-containing protein [Vallitalea okinawensis]
MDRVKNLTTLEEVKVFSDPYRMKILKCVLEANEPMTVKQMGVALGEKPSKVHYHVQKLVAVNILVLDHTENINGIIAKYYLPTAESFVIKMDDDVKKSVSKSDIEGIFGNVFDLAKETFGFQIIKAEDYKKRHNLDKMPPSTKINGGVSFESIYVTEEELKEINRYMMDVFKKYEKDDNQGNKKKCDLLFAYMEEFDKE